MRYENEHTEYKSQLTDERGARPASRTWTKPIRA